MTSCGTKWEKTCNLFSQRQETQTVLAKFHDYCNKSLSLACEQHCTNQVSHLKFSNVSLVGVMRARACMNHVGFEITTETFSESQFWIRVKVNQKTEDKLAKEYYPCEFGKCICFLLLFREGVKKIDFFRKKS